MFTKTFIIAALFVALCASCGGVEPEEEYPLPPVAATEDDPVQHPYCGDGICDDGRGENEWWCTDCGYSPALGGPKDGGYCGDGVCFGGETMLSCFKDCRPKPYKQQPPWDPGWIDPVPWNGQDRIPPGPPPPVNRRLLPELELGPFDRPGSR